MALSLDLVPWLVDGIVQLGLAGVLLVVGFLRGANRAFVLFLVLISLSNIAGVLSRTATVDADYWWRVQPYLWLAMPFALLHFIAVFPAPRARFLRGPFAEVPLFASMVIVGGLYAADHALFWGDGVPPGGRAVGPLASMLALLLTPLLSCAAFVLARDASRGAQTTRAASLTVAIALGMEAALAGTGVLVRVTSGGAQFLGGNIAQAVALAFWAVPFVLALTELARALRRTEGRERASFRSGLLAIAITVVATVAVSRYGRSSTFAWGTFWSGTVDLAFVLLVTYALVRHRLFGIELGMKWSIQHATVLAGAGLAYVVATALADAWWPAAATLAGPTAVILLFPAFPSLMRLGRRVADASMPGVERTAEYLDARKLEVYRVALEEALLEHDAIPDHKARWLAALRTNLGITDRDHAILEHAVRKARGEPHVALAPGALILGRYEVERQLDEGGMARTYLAEDRERHGKVVVKALQPDRQGVEDLLHEARAIAQVRHPNVVSLVGVEHVGDEAFLVMEYVEGGSLAHRLKRGPLAEEEFCRLASDVLDALEAVHRAGLVHRDVKPSNVLLSREGRAKLGDFGVAHIQGFESTIGGGGRAVGTVRYMSPEQARGRPATPSSDLFSAAATLYEALAGRPYLEAKAGETSAELQFRAAQAGSFDRPVPGSAARCVWFAKALHPEPGHRFASARAMRDALDATLASASPEASPSC